jgi:hypothetical protein
MAAEAGTRRQGAEPEAFRRRVFYIPGYDPFHPRRYRELYRSEAAAQAAISGYDLTLKPKMTKGPYGWHVAARIGGAEVAADVEVLVWADLVKSSMARGIAGTYVQMLRTAAAYIGSGALFSLMRLRKGPVIAALYPIIFLICQLGLALVLGLYAGVSAGAGARALLGGLIAPHSAMLLGLAVAIGVGGFCVVTVLQWFKEHDNKIFAYYLMHDYAYSAQSMGANPPELEARMAGFTATIRAALDGDYDEVLVVGHSSGAHLAVSILSDMIRESLPVRRPALGFLSLGQVVPMVSFLPEATRLRADLAYLCARAELTWIDVTAPGDGCAFALCDPVSVTGVAPQSGKIWPLVISAAFTQSLSPERWKKLRWRFFRLHFQYLCAFDRPKDYDYFQITAGPMTLATRFHGRGPSKSRIETPVNRYRAVQ